MDPYVPEVKYLWWIDLIHVREVGLEWNVVGAAFCRFKGIGSVCKQHPDTKFEHSNHGASKQKFNHMTVY